MRITKPVSNLTAKIVSVVFAVVLWLIISLHAPFTYKVLMPIKYNGPSEGYIMTGSHPEKALVRIKGTGKSLLVFYIRRMFNPKLHYAMASLYGFSTKGKHQIDLDKNKVNLGDDSNLEVESILENAFFSIEIDRIDTRTIPVDLDNLPIFSVEKGYILVEKPQAKPGIVVVKGPVDTLDTMKTIIISSFLRNRVSPKDSVLKARLGKNLSEFVTIDPETINLHFSIEKLTQKVLTGMPLIFKDFPGKNVPHFIPDTLSVKIEGPESIVSRLEADDVLVTVRYQAFLEVRGKGENILKPEIILPEGTSIVTVTPEFLRFSVDPVND